MLPTLPLAGVESSEKLIQTKAAGVLAVKEETPGVLYFTVFADAFHLLLLCHLAQN